MLQPGDAAPEFEKYLDEWVLVNWYDLHPERSCAPVIFHHLRQHREELQELQCHPIGVAYDVDVAEVWSAMHGFLILSDTERTLSERYGALRTDFTDIPKRIAYLIDPAGKISRAFGWFDPDFFVDQVLHWIKTKREDFLTA